MVIVKYKKYIIILIISLFVFAVLLFMIFNRSNYVDKQEWLTYSPKQIIIENRISGLTLKPIVDETRINDFTALLKKIQILNNTPQQTWGLGYSIRLDYDNYSIEYYFANSEHLFISKNSQVIGEYTIESTMGRSIYDLLEKLSIDEITPKP